MYTRMRFRIWSFADQDFKYFTFEDLATHKVDISSKIQDSRLMACTGMYDSNGTDIYQGDILKLVNADGKVIIVECAYGVVRRKMGTGFVCDIPSFHFKHQDGYRSYPIVENYAGKHDLAIMEVVGNIYQNKEFQI